MEIYQRYGRALLRKAQRMLHNAQDAEDVVQGLFADLWSRGQTEVDLPYLYRAVTHRCLNLLRDRGNREDLLQQHEPVLRGPVRTLCEERVISLDILIKLVGRLDRRGREVLVYRYFDDLSQEEIARLMKVSRKTVGKRLSRIQQELRTLAGTPEVAP